MELNRCSVNAEKMLKQQLWKCGHFRRIEVLFNVLLTGEFYKLLSHIHFRKQFSGGFCKIGVLQNFAKFRGKHLCQSLFLKKGAGLRPETSLKKRLWHKCFPVNFAESFFYRTHLMAPSSFSSCFMGLSPLFSSQKKNDWLFQKTQKKLLQHEKEKEVSVIENLLIFLRTFKFCKWFFIIDYPLGKFLLLATVQNPVKHSLTLKIYTLWYDLEPIIWQTNHLLWNQKEGQEKNQRI